ncbi:MAG: DUF975 family protein [Butyrivibrio sp.]|nr:DUF975 family protein [Butyrivibrio sp.]
MDIKEIKQTGKTAFRANYWRCVVVAFLLGILTAGTSAAAGSSAPVPGTDITTQEQEVTDALNSLTPDQQLQFVTIILGAVSVILVISMLLKIFLSNPLQVGGFRFFRKNVTDPSTGIGVVGEGFGNYGHTFLTLLLCDIFLALWTMLLVIPGIIKAYSYRLVPYLIKDHPELSATETITRSRELMNGHKMEAFILDLSFIGWYLLGVITLNLVNIFWTDPYRHSASAAFYLRLTEA